MQTVEQSVRITQNVRPEVSADRSTWLSTLTYRSVAVNPMSELELQRLLRSAQARNRIEGITGLVVYDQGRIFQWLEGPAEGLARVWNSVQRDTRHTAIEMMGNEPTPVRFFGDWDLKLSNRDQFARAARSDAFDIPYELVEGLYRFPEAAPALLASLAPKPLRSAPVLVARSVAPALVELVKRAVIPRLVARHAAPQMLVSHDVHPRAGELARLLLATDASLATFLIDEAHTKQRSVSELMATLIEPAARALGDLWQSDDCSELDVTLGLFRLQTSLRECSTAGPRRTLPAPPSVLIATAPGEGHLLSAALDTEMMWRAGWDTQAEFPVDDAALGALLSGEWFDALDLSLSPAFRREHSLTRLGATIASARIASRNPALVVVVGGRVFGAPGITDVGVGADASFGSAAEVVSTILERLTLSTR